MVEGQGCCWLPAKVHRHRRFLQHQPVGGENHCYTTKGSLENTKNDCHKNIQQKHTLETAPLLWKNSHETGVFFWKNARNPGKSFGLEGWLYWTVWIFAGLAIIEALQQGDATGLATARLANQCHNLSKLLRCISLTQAKLLNHGKIPKKNGIDLNYQCRMSIINS